MRYIKELIEALPGVEFVHITKNDTYSYDKKADLPPHSIKIYVLGGKKKEVAEIIWLNKVAGVMPVGNTKVSVDYGGFKYPIRFERLL